MKKCVKIALRKDQVKAINDDPKNLDGIEIQLLDKSDDLEMMKEIFSLPIVSIHYYLKYIKKEDMVTAEDVPASLESIIQDDGEISDFIKVAHYAKLFDCPIVLHGILPFDDLDHPRALLFLDIVRNLNVKICLENSGEILKGDVKILNIIPDTCKKFNEILGKELFYPLLDLCHVKKILKTIPSISKEQWIEIIKITIKNYESKNMFVHFCNMEKDAEGPDHGQNFYGHEKEMESYLETIYNIDPNTNLILEVYEEDHINKPNTVQLNQLIKKWEKHNNK